MNKEVVLISRNWDKPEIKIQVTDKGIGLEMSLSDFINSIALEIGNPTLLFTTDQLRRNLLDASNKICLENKKLTAQVM